MAESGKVYQIQYPTTVSGKVYKVRDVTDEKNVSGKVYQVKGLGGGGSGVQINNQDINVTQNGIYQAEEGYTGLGTVNVNVASGSPTQKFGVTIDNFLGDVDADGNYVIPTESFEVNLAGIKSVPHSGFYYKFALTKIATLLCNEVTHVGSFGFSYALTTIPAAAIPVIVEFNSLEEVTEDSAFAYFCANRPVDSKVSLYFNALKVISGNNSFKFFASLQVIDIPSAFPVLEEIKGNSCMDSFCSFNNTNTNLLFPKVKKITGSSGQYQSIFGYSNLTNSVWKFPEATEFSGYIWTDTGGTSNSELHFAAKNQAAIEACEGYANKWGLQGATIYFDL